MSSGIPAISLESRPAFAFVVVLHVVAILLLVHLIDAHRRMPRAPLIVEILKAPEPEEKKPPPKIKPPPPPPVVEVPIKEPPPKEPPPKKILEKEPPKEIPPEPPKPEPIREEPPPEPVLQKPDTLPKPLPVTDLPPPPKPVTPIAPQPVAKPEAPVVEVQQPKPVQLAPREPVNRPTPVVERPPVVPTPATPPQPVVQRPETPAVPPPPRPVSTPQIREAPPPPPVRVTQAPAPVEAPRLPDPTLAIKRDVPDARPVQLAPREPTQRPAMQRPAVPPPVAAPAQVAVGEPTPQIVFLPVPPPGASAEVVDEIALGAELLRANYLSNPKPLYPAISKRMKEQGTVLLRVFVTATGHPQKVTLKESSGFPRLDHAAEQAVPGWRFVPATRDDKPIDAWVIVPIKFSLSD